VTLAEIRAEVERHLAVSALSGASRAVSEGTAQRVLAALLRAHLRPRCTLLWYGEPWLLERFEHGDLIFHRPRSVIRLDRLPDGAPAGRRAGRPGRRGSARNVTVAARHVTPVRYAFGCSQDGTKVAPGAAYAASAASGVGTAGAGWGSMTNMKLADGEYRVRETTRNPLPAREHRKEGGWLRAAVWDRGLQITVKDGRLSGYPGHGRHPPPLTAAQQRLVCQAITPMLTPWAPSVPSELHELPYQGASRVLDALALAGKITLDDVREACAVVKAVRDIDEVFEGLRALHGGAS